MIKTKFCKCCKEEQWIQNFKSTDNSDDGLFPFCNQCVIDLRTVQLANYLKYRSLKPAHCFNWVTMESLLQGRKHAQTLQERQQREAEVLVCQQ